MTPSENRQSIRRLERRVAKLEKQEQPRPRYRLRALEDVQERRRDDCPAINVSREWGALPPESAQPWEWAGPAWHDYYAPLEPDSDGEPIVWDEEDQALADPGRGQADRIRELSQERDAAIEGARHKSELLDDLKRCLRRILGGDDESPPGSVYDLAGQLKARLRDLEQQLARVTEERDEALRRAAWWEDKYAAMSQRRDECKQDRDEARDQLAQERRRAEEESEMRALAEDGWSGASASLRAAADEYEQLMRDRDEAREQRDSLQERLEVCASMEVTIRAECGAGTGEDTELAVRRVTVERDESRERVQELEREREKAASTWRLVSIDDIDISGWHIRARKAERANAELRAEVQDLRGRIIDAMADIATVTVEDGAAYDLDIRTAVKVLTDEVRGLRQEVERRVQEERVGCWQLCAAMAQERRREASKGQSPVGEALLDVQARALREASDRLRNRTTEGGQ